MISRRSPPRIATHQIQPAMAAVATPDTAIATTGGAGGGQMGAPRAGQDAGHQREAGDGVGRVHERDHADHRRARVGAQQHAPQRGQEQDHDRRSQHEERERGRLVDLHDQPVDQRAQIPGGHDGGEVAGQPPAGQPLGHRVDAEDRRQAAERRQQDERRPGVDAGDPGDAGPGRVQQREGVAGVRRAVLERRDGRQRKPVDALDLAHPPDVEQRVADHAGGQPPGQERERHRCRPRRRRSRPAAPPRGRAGRRSAYAIPPQPRISTAASG